MDSAQVIKSLTYMCKRKYSDKILKWRPHEHCPVEGPQIKNLIRSLTQMEDITTAFVLTKME